MRKLSDGEREIWNEMQRDAAPTEQDYRALSRGEHTRGPKPCICDYCTDPILTGQRYAMVSLINEGKFEQIRHHVPACPSLHAILAAGDPPEWAGHEEDLFHEEPRAIRTAFGTTERAE